VRLRLAWRLKRKLRRARLYFDTREPDVRMSFQKFLFLTIAIPYLVGIASQTVWGASSSATLTVTATVVRSCQFSFVQGISAVRSIAGGQWPDSTGTQSSIGSCQSSLAPLITIEPTHHTFDNNHGLAQTDGGHVNDRVHTELSFRNTASGTGVKISHRLATTPDVPKITTLPASDRAPKSGASEVNSGSVTVTIDF